MNISFRITTLIAFIVSIFISFPLHAAAWPEAKPIRIIVPWPAGSGTDNITRLLAAELNVRLKQQFIVENRPGAGGVIGMKAAANSPADGYTFMMTSTAYAYLINRDTAGVDLVKDFSPVSLVATFESAIIVRPDFPAKTVGELLELAKAKPGELNYASSGVGGFGHMNTELFKYETGADLVHVPYLGGTQATLSLVSGDTHVYFGSLLTPSALLKSGRLKVLAVGGAKRNPEMPDVQTISETVPGYETFIWYGMFAPAGTPSDIQAKLHAAINDALESPGLKEKLQAQGAQVETKSTQEFKDLVVSESAKSLKVIEAAGIK